MSNVKVRYCSVKRQENVSGTSRAFLLVDRGYKPLTVLFLWTLFTGLLVNSSLIAQTPGESVIPLIGAEEDTQRLPASLAIAAPQIPRRAGEAEIKLQNIQTELIAAPAVSKIGEALSVQVDSLRKFRSSERYVALDKLTVRTMGEAREYWIRFLNKLQTRGDILSTRAEVLENNRKSLGQMRLIWEATRDTAIAEAFPQALIERTAMVLQRIEEVEKELRLRLNEILVFQNQASEGEVIVNGILDRIHEAERNVRQSLFRFDNPPLWNAVLKPADKTTIKSRIRLVGRAAWSYLEEFYSANQQRLLFHVMLFIVITWLLTYLHRRSRQWKMSDDDTTLQASVRILSRPLSASLIIALLLTFSLYPHASVVVYNIATIAMIIPVMRLLPGVIYEEMKRPLYAIGLIFLFDQVYDLTFEQFLLQRLYLLGLTSLAFGVIVWILNVAREAPPEKRSRWNRSTLVTTYLGAIALVLSMITNLFGNLSLAELLCDSTLNLAYFAILLYAGGLVLKSASVLLLRTRVMQSLRLIRKHVDSLRKRLFSFIDFAMRALWVYLALLLFLLLDPVVGLLSSVLGAHLDVGSIHVSLGDVLAFFFTIWLSVQISRLVSFVLEEDVLPHVKLPRGIPGTISMLSRYTIITLGFLVAVAAAGIELSRLTILAGALGVGIGFGLQNVVNNFISGLILIFERPIKAGDTIQRGSLMGVVRRIGIRSSTVRTFDGAEVIVPNGNLISEEVINWTLSDQLRRIEVSLGVAYGSNPKQVLAILEEVARSSERVLEFPEPFALFRGFGDSSLDFSLFLWTADFDNWRRVSSEVTVMVYEALQKAGIEIPFPQRDLHLRSIDPQLNKTQLEKAIVEKDHDSKKSG